MTYSVDNKTFLCQHNKLHLFTARKGKWTSETINRDIEKSFRTTDRNTPLQRVDKIYQIRNGLIVRLTMISFVAQIVLNNLVWR